MPTTDFLTPDEAAEVLGVSRSTVIRWIADEEAVHDTELRGMKVGGRWLVSNASVRELRDEIKAAAQ